MTTEELVSAFNAGLVKESTLVWRDGLEDWAPIAEIAGELGVVVKPRVPLPRPHVGIIDTPPEPDPAPELPRPTSVAISFRPRLAPSEREKAEALAYEAHLKRAKECTACGHIGRPLKVGRGSFELEILLWLCLILPGLLYSLWRRKGGEACAICGHTSLRSLAHENSPDAQP